VVLPGSARLRAERERSAINRWQNRKTLYVKPTKKQFETYCERMKKPGKLV
jgi:hypothetical protein